MDKKKVFIIGLGRMGISHIQAVLALGFTISGISDLLGERMRMIGDHISLAESCQFVNYKNLLCSNLTADILIVATTADVHADIVCEAAQRGIPYILCEKPMATSLADCEKMLNYCRKFGSLLAVNHPMRFMPRYVNVKECIASNFFGELSSMHVVGGAFGVVMNGSHYIEACSFMTETLPCEVTAWLSKELESPRGAQFNDWSGQARLVYENDQHLFIDADYKQGYGMTSTYATKCGYLFVDELAGEINGVVRQDGYLNRPTTQYGLPSKKIQKLFKPFDNVQGCKSVVAS